MENIQILYSSWCNEKGHNKVWGYFYLGADRDSHLADGTPVFVFYGAKGKALQLKQHCIGDDLLKLVRSKERKGYTRVYEWDFDDDCPNFNEEVEGKLTFAILAGSRYKVAE